MIDLYAWPTPNAQKVSIMLEECALPYTVITVDITKGEQFDPAFLKINPNNRIPAIVDRDTVGPNPVTVFESGAILFYLAEKTGRFLPASGEGRYAVMQWLMFQMGGLGPMCGQAHHFRQAMGGIEVPYGVERYTKEVGRLYGVMDRRLGEAAYLAGEYSIADMACYPWLRSSERQGQNLDDFPNVKRWYQAIEARPAVQRGLQVLAEHQKKPNQKMTEKERSIMFGSEQYARR